MTRRLMPLVAVVMGVAVMGWGTPAAIATARSLDDPPWLDRLKAWSAAVDQHVPGQADGAVVTVGAWDAESVHAVIADFLALYEWRVKLPVGSVQTKTHKKYKVTTGLLAELAVLRRLEPEALNRVLRRAAMLHADVALTPQLDWSRKTGTPDSILIEDGVVVGYESTSAHWVVGRLLLDQITPHPAQDPFVARWYQATLAAMLDDGNLTAMRAHIARATQLFPDDADVRFEQGSMHQIIASPSPQAVNRMVQKTRRVSANTRSVGNVLVEDMGQHVKDAERYLRRAVVLNPEHQEARVRLGFVLLQLGRPADARVELAQASDSGDAPVLRYLALMMRGAAEERLGSGDLAMSHYDKAAALFPRARSPLFAKAAVLRRAGRRDDAWALMERVMAPEAADQMVADPWWSFPSKPVRPSKPILKSLHAMLAPGSSS